MKQLFILIGFVVTTVAHGQILDSSKIMEYNGKKYAFQQKISGETISKNNSAIFSYDTLSIYVSSKHYQIYINKKGIVVIKGKTKGYRVKHPKGGRIKYVQTGTWRYYNNEGKLIAKRKFKFPNKKHRPTA